jgi:hypothetical protein
MILLLVYPIMCFPLGGEFHGYAIHVPSVFITNYLGETESYLTAALDDALEDALRWHEAFVCVIGYTHDCVSHGVRGM